MPNPEEKCRTQNFCIEAKHLCRTALTAALPEVSALVEELSLPHPACPDTPEYQPVLRGLEFPHSYLSEMGCSSEPDASETVSQNPNNVPVEHARTSACLGKFL